MLGVELAQQELSGQSLGHEVGHPVAVVAVEDPIQEAVVLTSGTDRSEALETSVEGEEGPKLGETRDPALWLQAPPPAMTCRDAPLPLPQASPGLV